MLDGEVDGVNRNQVWRDLLRLRRTVAEFEESNEKSRKFLATARYIDTPLPGTTGVGAPMLKTSVRELRDRAAKMREIADLLEHQITRQTFLQIAESYERLAEDCQ
jgi:hypothetical protein